MIRDQLFDTRHLEWHTHRDADRAHRQEFDDPFQSQRAARTDAFQRRQTDHLRSIKEELLGTAFARVHGKLRDGLAEQFPDRQAHHLVSHIESVDVNYFPNITADGTQYAGTK